MKITNQFKSKLRTYFVKRLGAYDYRHGWMRVPTCPYCGREHKLGVNLSMYRTNCFRCNAHPSPSQLVMDIEGFTEYHELLNFLNNGQFDELTFKEEKIELAEGKPIYLPEGFRNISMGKSQLAKSIRGYVKSVDSISAAFRDMALAMAQLNHSMDISLSRSIIKDNLNTTMPVTSLVRDHDITTLTKISQVLESNSSYLIMTHWRCIGRYSYAREHLMLSQWGIEALPQWVKLLVPTKSMSYLNPNAKDLLYCWTQMPSNMPSTWVSSLLTIRKSRWCFYQTVKM